MNDILWMVTIVNRDDWNLIDRTGRKTVATTDPMTYTVFLSEDLKGDFLVTVLIHELAHCAMVSYNLYNNVRKMTKQEYWIEMEEFICNFIADYGRIIYNTAYEIMGTNAIKMIPKMLDNVYK